jgi:hypothetical protein
MAHLTRGAIVVAAVVVLVAGTPVTDARFIGQASTTGAVATRTWFFLHNNPSPPTGTTTAQPNLAMNAVAPTATTLFNYDTDADALPGRRIRQNGSGPADTNLGRYANWRSPPFASAVTVTGTVTVRVWTAVTDFQLNTRGVLVAYLRDYNPTTGAYVTIASATLDEPDWQGGVAAWVEKRFSIVVPGYTLLAGRQLELKLHAPAAAPRHMMVAYDTAAHPSILGLP